MPINTRDKRASALNLFLPFGRVGPNPSGSNLGTVQKREQAAESYAFLTVAALSLGANTPAKRASAVNLFLPFGRNGVTPDGTGLITAPKRTWSGGFGYDALVGSAIPTAYSFTAVASAQAAACQSQLTRIPKIPVVRPAPVVTSRTIGWDALVREAEGDAYQARMPYVVYQFGGGRQKRTFIEYV